MIRFRSLAAVTAVLVMAALTTSPASAEKSHPYRHSAPIYDPLLLPSERMFAAPSPYIEYGEVRQVRRTSHQKTQTAARLDANGTEARIIGGRPSGCPHAFCGCEASRYLFGRIHAELNLAANWIRKFPRAAPAAGMAAARTHHVMVLISHVGGNNWLVHDGNSGHGLTREHVRSIAGYVIVNPHAGRYAAL